MNVKITFYTLHFIHRNILFCTDVRLNIHTFFSKLYTHSKNQQRGLHFGYHRYRRFLFSVNQCIKLPILRNIFYIPHHLLYETNFIRYKSNLKIIFRTSHEYQKFVFSIKLRSKFLLPSLSTVQISKRILGYPYFQKKKKKTKLVLSPLSEQAPMHRPEQFRRVSPSRS